MATIDILTVIDPLGLADNSATLTTPIQNIPMLSTAILNAYVWMIAESASVRSGQATWNLSIEARANDTIRWWDVSVVQDTNTDIVIIDFAVSSNWSSVLEQPTAGTQADGVAYIQSGFQLGNISQLKFAMNSFQNNYIATTVKPNAAPNTTVNYTLTVAKLDVSRVGTPALKGLYRFDPTIIIVPR